MAFPQFGRKLFEGEAMLLRVEGGRRPNDASDHCWRLLDVFVPIYLVRVVVGKGRIDRIIVMFDEY